MGRIFEIFKHIVAGGKLPPREVEEELEEPLERGLYHADAVKLARLQVASKWEGVQYYGDGSEEASETRRQTLEGLGLAKPKPSAKKKPPKTKRAILAELERVKNKLKAITGTADD